jgi:hypothetical protein
MPHMKPETDLSIDPFDNLQEWGLVLKNLDQLKSSGRLDGHQSGLIRLLRYKNNWRLREASLAGMALVEHPIPELIREILDVILSDSAYYELRVLAADTLAGLARNTAANGSYAAAFRPVPVSHELRALIRVPHPPILADAVLRCLGCISEADHRQSDFP